LGAWRYHVIMLRKSFRFGPFRFEADRGILYKNGRPLRLGSKAAILLFKLLEARGAVVAKADLMEAAWPCLYAEESNLSVQIAALRLCLGDDRKCPTWIETIHGIGYRFVGTFRFDFDRSTASLSPNSTFRNWPIVLLLPFDTAQSEALQPEIVEDFHDNLIVELSRLPVQFKTIGNDSSETNQPGELEAIDYWISGRFCCNRGRLRVEATIGDRRTMKCPQYVSIFEGNLSNLFNFHAEAAYKVSALLRNLLSKGSNFGENFVEGVAQRHYQRGCKLLVNSHSANRYARWHLSKAIELRPDFARAYAFLGLAHYTAAIHYGEDVQANRALALVYAEKAVSLDPKESMGHGALGFVKLYDGQLAEAEDCVLAAYHLDTSDMYARMNLIELCVMKGRPEDAIQYARNSVTEGDIPQGCYYWVLAFGFYAAGMYRNAIEALSQPETQTLPGKRLLAASLAQLGNRREAKAEAESYLAAYPQFSVSAWSETQPFARIGDRRHFVDGFTKADFPR
jgi:DNA-binding winged helix-turn-helix (wHTH) protein